MISYAEDHAGRMRALRDTELEYMERERSGRKPPSARAAR